MSEASTRPDDDLDRRLAQVRLAVFDVDGTLTDGRVTYRNVGDRDVGL